MLLSRVEQQMNMPEVSQLAAARVYRLTDRHLNKHCGFKHGDSLGSSMCCLQPVPWCHA